MKKFTAIFAAIVLVASMAAVIPAHAAEEFSYVHIVASGNDPYATFNFSPDGNNTTIDPDTVKWAAIKYRTITETDNTGVQLIGQLYVNPAVEPFVPIKYVHSGNWEITVVDLNSVSEKTSLESAWNSSKYTDGSAVRFDPLESNRDAEAQDGENDVARVSDGDCIDIAFIAFFEKEEDAKAYDGTQNTPYCVIMPEDLEWGSGGNAMGDVEFVEGKKPRPETTPAVTTEAQTTEAQTTEAQTTEALTTEAENSEPISTEADNASDVVTTEAPEGTAEDTDTGVEEKTASKFPVWAIILIAVATVVLVAAIITALTKKKKA